MVNGKEEEGERKRGEKGVGLQTEELEGSQSSAGAECYGHGVWPSLLSLKPARQPPAHSALVQDSLKARAHML